MSLKPLYLTELKDWAEVQISLAKSKHVRSLLSITRTLRVRGIAKGIYEAAENRDVTSKLVIFDGQKRWVMSAKIEYAFKQILDLFDCDYLPLCISLRTAGICGLRKNR